MIQTDGVMAKCERTRNERADGCFFRRPDDLPAGPGAYVLLIELRLELAVAWAGKRGVLAPGRYLYCGSAKGPGGLKARLARHMRRDKKPHWHVDTLTMAGHVLGAWVFANGDECALATAFGAFPAPLPRFGATDCRQGCASHLFFWSDGMALPFPPPGFLDAHVT